MLKYSHSLCISVSSVEPITHHLSLWHQYGVTVTALLPVCQHLRSIIRGFVSWWLSVWSVHVLSVCVSLLCVPLFALMVQTHWLQHLHGPYNKLLLQSCLECCLHIFWPGYKSTSNQNLQIQVYLHCMCTCDIILITCSNSNSLVSLLYRGYTFQCTTFNWWNWYSLLVLSF